EEMAEANSTVQLFVNGVPNATGQADAQGNWLIRLSSPLADGTYQITAQATDLAGNVGPMSLALVPPLVIDTKPPASTITFPSAPSYSAAGWLGSIKGTASDTGAAGIATVGVSIFDGSKYWNGSAFASSTPFFNPATISQNGWSYPFASSNL